MSATVADLNPKTLDNAKRQFVEVYGSALVLNTYLKIALVLVSLVALGLVAFNFHTAGQAAQLKPLVIRIDDIGRAEAVQYKRDGVPAAGARTAVFPDPVYGETFQPDPGDDPARVSGFPVLPRARAGGRHDRAERAEPSPGSLPDQRHRGRD